ncbi:MAG: succinate dehydrogenase, hydrophobic membrane anchor protein [Ghiorsea sp.]
MSNQYNQDLGAAKTGFHDWYWQRISAVVLFILLPVFFILFIAVYTGKIDYPSLNHWLTHPLGKTLSTLFLFALALHMWTGMKVIFEDYVHTAAGRILVLNILLAALILFTVYMTYHIWAEAGYICLSCIKGEG